jgi:transcriptional regulator with XRE-family HTH domain
MSQEARKYIAKNVNKYRIIKGLTKEELSLILGFDNSYISKLERKNVNITIDKLEKIAKALDVELVELFQFTMTKEKDFKTEINRIYDGLNREKQFILYKVATGLEK